MQGNPPLADLARQLDAYLRPRVAAEPELAALVAAAARWLADLADDGRPVAELQKPSGAAEQNEANKGLYPVEPDPPPPEAEPAQLAELSPAEVDSLRRHFEQGGFVPPPAEPVPETTPTVQRDVPDGDLAALTACARVKADAASDRAAGAPDRREHRLRSQAGEAGPCDLWMLDDDAPDAPAEAYRRLAATYANLAAVAEVLDAMTRRGDAPATDRAVQHAMFLAAEAQSALRVAFHAVYGRDAAQTRPGAHADDAVQLGLFTWLRETARIDRVFITEYMKYGEPADPGRAEALAREIDALRTAAGLEATAEPSPADRLRKAALYHLGRLADGGYDAGTQAASAAAKIADAVGAGLAPSDVALREALLDVYDRPEALALLRDAADGSDGLRLALRETDRYLGSRPDDDEDEDDDSAPLTDEVREVARRLDGRAIALFGGVPKPHVVERIREAFGASEVVWEETRAHQSTAPFEAAVARPDVALVGLFIRWCSHSFDDLREMCERNGKPYVRVKAGNHPNRLAREVMDQVSSELGA